MNIRKRSLIIGAGVIVGIIVVGGLGGLKAQYDAHRYLHVRRSQQAAITTLSESGPAYRLASAVSFSALPIQAIVSDIQTGCTIFTSSQKSLAPPSVRLAANPFGFLSPAYRSAKKTGSLEPGTLRNLQSNLATMAQNCPQQTKIVTLSYAAFNTKDPAQQASRNRQLSALYKTDCPYAASLQPACNTAALLWVDEADNDTAKVAGDYVQQQADLAAENAHGVQLCQALQAAQPAIYQQFASYGETCDDNSSASQTLAAITGKLFENTQNAIYKYARQASQHR